MTGAEIVTMVETMVGDDLDSVLAYQMLNVAKDKIEGERDWAILKRLQQLSAGTSANTLPTDYARTIAMYVNNQPYLEIPYTEQKLQSLSALRWFLDMYAGTYTLIGTTISGTINHFYVRTTDPITSATSPVWPSRFHPLIAYEMARDYFAIDQGERGRSWDDKFAFMHETLRRSMVDWDAQLQRRANENTTTYDENYEIPLGML